LDRKLNALKFISLNIWEGGRLLKRVIQFLRWEKPQILALQEVYDSCGRFLEERFQSLELIKNKVGYKYSFFSAAFTEIRQNLTLVSGNAILSDFPFKRSETFFFDRSFSRREPRLQDFSETPRNLQLARIDVGGYQLNVCNTHGIWGSNGGDNPRRLAMADRIVDIVKDKENLILSGDFNVRDTTLCAERIEQQHLTNVFKGKIRTSFNLRRKDSGIFGEAVVDMIFVSREIKVLRSYCPNVDISDHLPQVIVFRPK
jgi:endonuclease/exonuclease/phosphatase family metal-dependent hydrolase